MGILTRLFEMSRRYRSTAAAILDLHTGPDGPAPASPPKPARFERTIDTARDPGRLIH